MKQFARHGLLLLLAAAGLAFGAKPPQTLTPVGRFEVKKQDGTPPIDGATVETEVTQPIPFVPVYICKVYIDYHDGEGPQPLDGEGSVITPRTDPNDPGYQWTNERGNSGTLDRRRDGDFDSKVTTGPHAGTERHWDRK